MLNILLSHIWIGWSVEGILIAIVLICAGVALVSIAIRQLQIPIPSWVIQVFWVLAIAIVIVLAIRLLFSL